MGDVTHFVEKNQFDSKYLVPKCNQQVLSYTEQNRFSFDITKVTCKKCKKYYSIEQGEKTMETYKHKVHWVSYPTKGKNYVGPRCGEAYLDPRNSEEAKRFSEDIKNVTCKKCQRIYNLVQESSKSTDTGLKTHFVTNPAFSSYSICNTLVQDVARRTDDRKKVTCIKCKVLLEESNEFYAEVNKKAEVTTVSEEPEVSKEFAKLARWIKETKSDVEKYEIIQEDLMIIPVERVKLFLDLLSLFIKE